MPDKRFEKPPEERRLDDAFPTGEYPTPYIPPISDGQPKDDIYARIHGLSPGLSPELSPSLYHKYREDLSKPMPGLDLNDDPGNPYKVNVSREEAPTPGRVTYVMPDGTKQEMYVGDTNSVIPIRTKDGWAMPVGAYLFDDESPHHQIPGGGTLKTVIDPKGNLVSRWVPDDPRLNIVDKELQSPPLDEPKKNLPFPPRRVSFLPDGTIDFYGVHEEEGHEPVGKITLADGTVALMPDEEGEGPQRRFSKPLLEYNPIIESLERARIKQYPEDGLTE